MHLGTGWQVCSTILATATVSPSPALCCQPRHKELAIPPPHLALPFAYLAKQVLLSSSLLGAGSRRRQSLLCIRDDTSLEHYLGAEFFAVTGMHFGFDVGSGRCAAGTCKLGVGI